MQKVISAGNRTKGEFYKLVEGVNPVDIGLSLFVSCEGCCSCFKTYICHYFGPCSLYNTAWTVYIDNTHTHI